MSQSFNRGTGLLIINVVNSNPNGDPDAESEPRTFDDGRGLISPVSFKRKIRDLMFNPKDPTVDRKDSDPSEEGEVRKAASAALDMKAHSRAFDILEMRGRQRKTIEAMDASTFQQKYWDARVFGNTFLESLKDDKSQQSRRDRGHFITTGVVQFGPGVSIAPVEVQRLTLTNRSGVENDKDRGMAPLGFRVVRHGLYVMPFFVNPSAAGKSGCDATDIQLLKFLIPHAYAHTASAIRPQVEIVHAWYAEHKSPLGSCPDPRLHAALTPRKKADPERASTSLDDYETPTDLPEDLKARLASFEDLAVKDWSVRVAP